MWFLSLYMYQTNFQTPKSKCKSRQRCVGCWSSGKRHIWVHTPAGDVAMRASSTWIILYKCPHDVSYVCNDCADTMKPRIRTHASQGARLAHAQQDRNKMPMLPCASTMAHVDEYIFHSTLLVTIIYLYIPTINIRIKTRCCKRTYWMQPHQKSPRDTKNSLEIGAH